MIVLDTNVISELMRPKPHPAVLGWVAARPRATLYTTGINQAEILFGIAALPEGKRRAALAAAAEAVFAEDLAGRILSFGSTAARQPRTMPELSPAVAGRVSRSKGSTP